MDMRGEPTLQLGDDPNTGGQTLLLNPRYDSLVKEHYNVFRGSYRSGSRFREFLVQRSDQISTGLGCGMTSLQTRSDGCYTLRVPQGRPGVRVAASGRPSSSHPIRLAWWHLELLSGGPVRYEGRAVGA